MPVREEALELRAAPVDHAERGVARAGELGGRLDEPLQERVERELRGERDACLDQRAQAIFARPDRVHGVQRIRVDSVRSYGPRVRRTPDGADAAVPTRLRRTDAKGGTMKALVYHGPGQRSWEEKPDPTIQEPTDIVVRIDSSTICGTDLHILKGDVPEVKPGTILGHEAVGTVVEIGAAVTTLEPGDRVLVSCITSCGRCRFCKEGHYGLCTGGGGWIFGHLIDGLQAEYARVPFADTSVYKVPDELSDEQVLFLADILPTAYEVGVLNGERRARATRSRSSAPARSASRRS